MHYALPAIYALLVWWVGTGFALYIVGLPRSTHRRSMIGAGVVFAVSLYGVMVTSRGAGTFDIYAAFTCAILLWGAIEVSFLTGFVTGPHRGACPPDCEPWLRAFYAIAAILYHEVLLLAVGAAIVALTWRSANPVAAWTFALLWVMRLSAKLNLFLGVPVLNDQLLPDAVAHLKSYFRQRPVSLFFPVSVTLATVLTILLAEGSLLVSFIHPEGLVLLATLSALAVLEHWFMVLPLPLERLWSWASSKKTQREPAVTAPVRTILRVVEGARSQPAFEAWVAPLVNVGDAARPAASSEHRTNVHPHPALAKHRRRP